MIGTCFELIILWKTSIDWWLGESIDEVQIEEKRCLFVKAQMTPNIHDHDLQSITMFPRHFKHQITTI
jgi:hypothetical protein